MKKHAILIFVLLLPVLFLSSCMTGCTTYQDRINALQRIAIETQTKYVFVGERGVAIDGKYHSYERAASRFIKTPRNQQQGRAFDVTHGENKAFFMYYYRSVFNSRGNQTSTTIDAGLFSFDYRTAETVFVKDFKNVLTWQWNSYPKMLHNVVDDKYAIFDHSAMLQIVNIENGETVFSQSFPYEYDEHGFIVRSTERGFLSNNNYYHKDGDTLHFYEYKTSTYEKTSFQVTDKEFQDFLNVHLPKSPEQKPNTITGGGVEYTYEINRWSNSIVFTDKMTEETITLDIPFFEENSRTYSRLVAAWNQRNNFSRPYPNFLTSHNGQLIVGCSSMGTKMTPGFPLILFEFDLTENSLRYIGFHRDFNLIKILSL